MNIVLYSTTSLICHFTGLAHLSVCLRPSVHLVRVPDSKAKMLRTTAVTGMYIYIGQ